MLFPSDAKSVFVVVPVYNEQDVIGQVIYDLGNYGYTLVMVDDGSITPLKLPTAGVDVHLLRHPVNLGQGAALQTGMQYAVEQGAAYVVTFDADGQHFAADVQGLLNALHDNDADVALGSRFLASANHNMPAARRRLLQTGRYINFLFTGLLLSDAHNGLRAFTREAATRIRFRENRMAHATELLRELRRHRLRWVEVPVSVQYTAYASAKGQRLTDGFGVLSDILLSKLFK